MSKYCLLMVLALYVAPPVLAENQLYIGGLYTNFTISSSDSARNKTTGETTSSAAKSETGTAFGYNGGIQFGENRRLNISHFPGLESVSSQKNASITSLSYDFISNSGGLFDKVYAGLGVSSITTERLSDSSTTSSKYSAIVPMGHLGGINKIAGRFVIDFGVQVYFEKQLHTYDFIADSNMEGSTVIELSNMFLILQYLF